MEGTFLSRIEIKKKTVLINSASSAIALLLNFSVLIWLQQYLLKRISPEEYSLVPILMAIMAFTPLMTMVLTDGIGRYVTVAYAKGDDAEVERICTTMFPILGLVGVVFLGFGWTCAWHIDVLLDIAPDLVAEAQIMLALLVFSAGIRIPLSAFGAGFLVKQKLMLQDIIDIGCQLLRFTVLFSLLFAVDTRVLWVIVAMVVGEIVNLIISTIISRRLVPAQRVRWGLFRRSIAGEITNYGGWAFVNRVADTVKQALDPIILNRFASAVDVSVFYVGGIAPRQLRLMLTPLSRPLLPVLAALYATGDLVRFRNTYLRTSRYHAWLLLIVGVPAMIFSTELMHLYLDGKYDEAGVVMSVLVFVTVLSAFNSLGPAAVAAAGQMKGMALRFLAVQSCNILLTILFVAYLQEGAFGSAISTLLAVVFLEVTLLWPFCRKVACTPTSLWVKEVVWPCLIPAIPSAILCIAVKVTVGVDTWFELFFVSILSAVLQFGLIGVFGLRQQDRVDIGRFAERLSGPTKTIVQCFAVK